MTESDAEFTGRVQDEAFLHLLRAIKGNPYTSQRKLAEATGMSLGKANYCLKALLDKGLIKIRNFRNSQNKLAYAYLLTPKGVAAKARLTARFFKRKTVECEALRREIEALKGEMGG